MVKRIFTVLLVLVVAAAAMIIPVDADVTIPTTIGAPQYFGVSSYLGDYFYYTFSAPDDLRAYIDGTAANFTARAQLDYKLDEGQWHYTSDWDTAKYTLKNQIGVAFVYNKSYISGSRESLTNLFPSQAAELKPVKDNAWNYFKDHSISFRIRYVATFDNGKNYVYSDWSNTYVLSQNVKSDPNQLINHAPILTTATVEKNSGGQPFLKIKTGRLPGETQDLNAMTAGAVWTEIWMKRAGDKEYKMINSSPFSNEYILIGVDDYFGVKPSYDTESYEIKIRYKLDTRAYKQSNRADIIYSPFSNIFSQNMPSWSGASTWATTELKKADEAGLIPSILKGADLTKPITREEFAELAVLLYEKTTGKASIAATPNIFTDTSNPQILKALRLDITKGTSATTFSPNLLINREQCSTMLFRTMKAIEPQSDYSIVGVKDFPDQKDISNWAADATKYISKIGIIKGDAQGNFMPKATTTAQEAAGYGMATREQAILMSYRTYGSYK